MVFKDVEGPPENPPAHQARPAEGPREPDAETPGISPEQIQQAKDIFSRIEAIRQAIRDTEGKAKWLDKRFIDPAVGAIGELFGLDLPFDIAMTLPAIWIVYKAKEAGVSGKTLLKMTGNILVDLGVDVIPGVIPVLGAVGSLFDVFWKANIKNVDLMAKEVAYLEAEYERISGKTVQQVINEAQAGEANAGVA